jgi:hypothetical protein
MQPLDRDSTHALGGKRQPAGLSQHVDFMKNMKKTPYCGCLLLLVSVNVALSPMAVRALDYHVNSAQTLQNALTLAAASSVSNNIYVTNGYYTGNFNYNSTTGNYLTLLAEPGVTNTQITIDGGGTGASMNISGTVTSNITVQGMTFLRNCGSTSIAGLQIAGPTNCQILVKGCLFLSPSNSSGMGLEISSGLNATVTNCTAAGNAGAGTGISIAGVISNVAVQECTITTNTGGWPSQGGGLYVSSANANVVAVTDCMFSGNTGTVGGASCTATTITLSGNNFTGNTANTGNGGGAYCCGTTLTVSGNNFNGNTANNDNSIITFGGGIDAQGANVRLSGNTFTSNTVSGWGHGYISGGGGACCSGVWTGVNEYLPATISLSDNTFTGNSAGDAAYGGGAYCYGSGPLSLSNNTFTGNSTENTGGGAYFCNSATNATLLCGNIFQQNTAAYGGGFVLSAPTINLLDNLVVSNGLNANGQGGGIWVDASAMLNMINNTVTGNTSPGSGGGVAYVMTGTVELLNIYNNIIWGNSAPVSGGDVWVSGTGQQTVFDNNDADSIYGVFSIAQNDIDLSPQFFNPIAGDYHTQGASPCKGAGSISAPSLPSTDLDGNPRILNGSVDLGCYEFTTAVTHPADTNALFVITPSEFSAYAAAWKNAQIWTNGPNPGPNPVPANYMTRAGYLMTNGGAYTNDGSARPLNWKTNQ